MSRRTEWCSVGTSARPGRSRPTRPRPASGKSASPPRPPKRPESTSSTARSRHTRSTEVTRGYRETLDDLAKPTNVLISSLGRSTFAMQESWVQVPSSPLRCHYHNVVPDHGAVRVSDRSDTLSAVLEP